MKKIRMVKLSLVLSLVMFFSMFQGVVASAQQYYDAKRAEGYRELDVLGKGMEMVKPGDVVTLTATVLEGHEPYFLGFRRWTFIEQDGIVCDNPPVAEGEKNMVGLGADELSQMTISFVMPDMDIKAYYDYYIDTVSGNKAWLGHWPVDTQYLRDKVDIDVSVGDGGGSTEGSSSNSNNAQETGNRNIVRKSDGTTITGAQIPMYYAARSITGVAVMTPKEEIDKAAGLSEEDVNSGTNAKYYIGDVYRGFDKKILRNAAESINGTLISILDIDLYTIEKSGRIEWVVPSAPIRFTFGIPTGKQLQGGRYCMVAYTYTGDGTKTEMVVLEDKDDDTATITVDLNNFIGPYAIVYIPD